MVHIGIDVHKNASQVCIRTETGQLIERRIRTDRKSFAKLLERFFENLFDRPAHLDSLPQGPPPWIPRANRAAVRASQREHHKLGGSRFKARNTENIAPTSASSKLTSGICDIVIRMSGNAFCSCSLDVFSSIPVRETVRESSESRELRAVRFPPPPLLKTSDCYRLAIPPIASDQIVTIGGWSRRGFVEFGDGVFEP